MERLAFVSGDMSSLGVARTEFPWQIPLAVPRGEPIIVASELAVTRTISAEREIENAISMD